MGDKPLKQKNVLTMFICTWYGHFNFPLPFYPSALCHGLAMAYEVNWWLEVTVLLYVSYNEIAKANSLDPEHAASSMLWNIAWALEVQQRCLRSDC